MYPPDFKMVTRNYVLRGVVKDYILIGVYIYNFNGTLHQRNRELVMERCRPAKPYMSQITDTYDQASDGLRHFPNTSEL